MNAISVTSVIRMGSCVKIGVAGISVGTIAALL